MTPRIGMKNVFACAAFRLFFLAWLTAPWAAVAAEAAARPGCTIVAGGGRNSTSSDSQVNDRWNRLNFSFFDAAAEAVRAEEPVEQAFFAVGSNDAARNAETMLAQAAKSGCRRIAFFSVFSDQDKADAELVFSLRVSPIRHQAPAVSGASAANFSLGEIEYEREYRFPATPASFDKVVPSRIADLAVRDYRASRRR
jgi:hypothetical protein